MSRRIMITRCDGTDCDADECEAPWIALCDEGICWGDLWLSTHADAIHAACHHLAHEHATVLAEAQRRAYGVRVRVYGDGYGLWLWGCSECSDPDDLFATGFAYDLPTAADAGRRHLLAAHDDVLDPGVLIRLATLVRVRGSEGPVEGEASTGTREARTAFKPPTRTSICHVSPTVTDEINEWINR